MEDLNMSFNPEEEQREVPINPDGDGVIIIGKI